MSSELWLAEGSTQYYGALVLGRAGLVDVRGTAATLAGFVASVVSRARTIRSAEDMSRMAAFTDGSDASPDRTNWPGTYVSVLRLWRGHRAQRSISPCATGRRAGWQLDDYDARDVARARQTRREASRIRGRGRTHGRTQ